VRKGGKKKKTGSLCVARKKVFIPFTKKKSRSVEREGCTGRRQGEEAFNYPDKRKKTNSRKQEDKRSNPAPKHLLLPLLWKNSSAREKVSAQVVKEGEEKA